MKRDDELHALLTPLEPPDPPPGLRERTVRAVTAALREPAPLDPWDRLWLSRRLRAAWATSVLALLAGHVLVSLHSRTAATTMAGAASAIAAEDPELRGPASLPRIDLDAHPLGGEALRPATPDPEPGPDGRPVHHDGKEHRT